MSFTTYDREGLGSKTAFLTEVKVLWEQLQSPHLKYTKSFIICPTKDLEFHSPNILSLSLSFLLNTIHEVTASILGWFAIASSVCGHELGQTLAGGEGQGRLVC